MSKDSLDSGWLKDYLDARKNIFISFLKGTEIDSHPEQSLYRMLQPKGLLYGHPVAPASETPEEGFAEVDNLKLLMAESLINGALIFNHGAIETEDDLGDALLETTQKIGDFYNKVYPEISVSSHSLFLKKRSPLEIAEKIIEKRIQSISSKDGDFWTNFFNNSLLFLDIYFFGQWLHTDADKAVTEFFKEEKDSLRFHLVKIFAAAAHANGTIEEQERKLFEYFLNSAGLTADQQKEAKVIFEEGVSLEAFAMPVQNSWILKKYFLELAILIVWADRKLETSEKEFLDQLTEKLGFYPDDLEHSLLAVEGFVLENWENLEQLQGEKEYSEISEEYLNKIKEMAARNARRLAEEIKGQSHMHMLLQKSAKSELTESERIELKEGLMKLLKSVPTFVVIGLPQTFLTLPVLLQVLPDNLLGDG